MKVAVISDIHGNLLALERVLDSLEKEGPDMVLCLGDVVAGGAFPHEVIRRLEGLHPVCINGNHDEWMLNPIPYQGDSPDMRLLIEADTWCSRQLTDADRGYIRSFSPTFELNLPDGLSLFAYHGSPRSNKEWIPATATDEELETILSGRRATLFIGGHSHKQLLRRHLASTLINPGSVGLPFQQGEPGDEVTIPPWSEFALLTIEQGDIDISFRRVSYDLAAYRSALESSGIPGGARLMDS